MNRKVCQYHLSCLASEQLKISEALLDKRLVSCVKFLPINSMYWWNDKIESAEEVLLVMESCEDMFSEIEKEISLLRSYDTFVLQQMPISLMNKKATDWILQYVRLPSK